MQTFLQLGDNPFLRVAPSVTCGHCTIGKLCGKLLCSCTRSCVGSLLFQASSLEWRSSSHWKSPKSTPRTHNLKSQGWAALPVQQHISPELCSLTSFRCPGVRWSMCSEKWMVHFEQCSNSNLKQFNFKTKGPCNISE